jgi:fatty-acid desaturase
MFSKLFKLIFVSTSYSPILMIWWIVGIFSYEDKEHKIQYRNFSELTFEIIQNKIFLPISFIVAISLLLFILYLANTKLTRNTLEIKSIKSSDFNSITILISYFLPCVELYKKDLIFIFFWFLILLLIVFINKSTYFFNPLVKLLGYRYYEIATKKEVSFTMISKRKIINPNDVNAYSQLTDYVILDTTKN